MARAESRQASTVRYVFSFRAEYWEMMRSQTRYDLSGWNTCHWWDGPAGRVGKSACISPQSESTRALVMVPFGPQVLPPPAPAPSPAPATWGSSMTLAATQTPSATQRAIAARISGVS
jgi:hypothetical protein